MWRGELRSFVSKSVEEFEVGLKRKKWREEVLEDLREKIQRKG